MSHPHPTHPHARLLEILAELVDGDITLAAAGELNNLLSHDTEARLIYGEFLDLHFNLTRRSVERSAMPARSTRHSTPKSTPHGVKPKSIFRAYGPTVIRFAAAAVLVLATVSVIALVLSRPSRHTTSSGPVVATLIDSSSPVWEQPSTETLLPTDVGSQLPGGWLKLKSGTVTLAFTSGAEVTLQGPAEFGLNSGFRGFLRAGRLTTYVPPEAHGFTIGAPGCSIVDLGTRYTLNVGADGTAEVSVLVGVVELKPVALDGTLGPPRKLTQRNALSIDASGRMSEIPFVNPEPTRSIIAYNVMPSEGSQNFDGSIGMDFEVDRPVRITHLERVMHFRW